MILEVYKGMCSRAGNRRGCCSDVAWPNWAWWTVRHPAAIGSGRLFAALRAVLLIWGLLGAAPVLSAAEPTLRFGIAADTPPLAFTDAGVLRGLEVDLSRALSAQLGMEMRLRALPQPRLAEALRGGRIDAMLASLPADELQVLGLAASEPVLDMGQMALVRVEDLPLHPRALDLITTTRRVGYERGTAGARFVQAHFSRAERVPLTDAATGITALRHGDIDVLVHDATTVWAVATDARERQLAGLFRPLTDERLAWVVREQDQPLLTAIDNIIRAWRSSGQLDRLINRWLPIQVRVER